MAEFNLMDDVETVHFDEFLPYVAVQVDGVPAEVMGHMIRLAAIDFARRTRVLRRTMFLNTQCGVQSYTLAHTDHYSVLAIDSVEHCGCCLRAERLSCTPRGTNWYAFEPPNRLYLGFAPDCDGVRDLEITAVVVPGQDSCGVDRLVYDLYAEGIAQGAVARLLLMSSEEWFNPTLATLAGRQFTAAISAARAMDAGRYSTAPQTIGMPKGFFV